MSPCLCVRPCLLLVKVFTGEGLHCTTKSPLLSFQLHRLLRVLQLYYKVASSHLPAPQILRTLQLYYNFASSHLPAPQRLRVLKLYYKVASSQLPAPQIVPRTKVVLESRQFSSSSSPETPRTQVVLQGRQFSASSSTDCSAYYSCTTKSPVLIFQLPTDTPRTKVVLQSRQFSSSSSPGTPRILKLYYKVASSQLPAPQIAPRTNDVLESRQCLHFAHSTRTVSAEGCARAGQIALSPAFRVLDTHDLRRGLRAHRSNRTLACISRTRHARSPQRVAFSVDAVRPTLHL